MIHVLRILRTSCLMSAFLLSGALARTPQPQGCGSLCTCNITDGATTDPQPPSCVASIVYSITSVATGCCTSASCAGPAASCGYSISFTGTSTGASDPGCCWGVFQNGGSNPIAQGLGALNFASGELPLACAGTDTWTVQVGGAGSAPNFCANGGIGPKVILTVVVTCQKGPRC